MAPSENAARAHSLIEGRAGNGVGVAERQGQVRVMRGAGAKEAWQVVCADCGPLQAFASHDESLAFGRRHLTRSHMGGRLATGMGPFHDVDAEFGEDLFQAIEELARWFEQHPDPTADAVELVHLSQVLLTAAGHAKAARTAARGDD